MSSEITRPQARLVVLWGTPSDVGAFDRHYRDVHIPLGNRLPGLRRYTHSRNIRGVRGEPYHLVATLEWDDLASLRVAFDSEIGRAIAADTTELARLAEVRGMIFELADLMP